MAADISALGNLQSSEPLDLDMYKGATSGGGFRLPKKGRYTVSAPPEIPATAFGATQAGYLKAQVDPTITDGPHAGFQIRYTSVSAKPFKRSGETVSQLADYLRACGVRGRISGDPQDLANLVESTAGRTYQVEVDWRAFDRNTGTAIEGMERFPKDETGEPVPFIETGEVDENGAPKRLRANVVVTRFVTQ